MGISLAVGHLTLDQAAEVRILHPQPSCIVARTGSLILTTSDSLLPIVLSSGMGIA